MTRPLSQPPPYATLAVPETSLPPRASSAQRHRDSRKERTSHDGDDGRRGRVAASICAACSLPISRGGQVAGGQPWHTACFKCPDCQKPFSEALKPYSREIDGRKYLFCETDYARRAGILCVVCQKVIARGEGTKVGDRVYHREHLECTICHDTIPTTPNSYVVANNEPYCRYHGATMVANRCDGCGEALLDAVFEGPVDLPGKYHESCRVLLETFDITLSTYNPKKAKAQSANREAYEQHATLMNKLSRKIAKHAQAFQKSAHCCLSNASGFAESQDWPRAIDASNKLRDHVTLLDDYFISLPSTGLHFSRDHASFYNNALKKVRAVDAQLSQLVLSGKQAGNSPAMMMACSRDVESSALGGFGPFTDLVRTLLEGLLSLSRKQGNFNATLALLAKFKEFPLERSRRSIGSRPSTPLSGSSLRPSISRSSLFSSAPSSPRSFISQLSEIAPDHFFQHSGDASTEVSTNLNVEAFCDEIRTNHGESKSRTISLIEWHKEPGMLHHEYLLVRARVPGRKDVWIRLERAAKRNARRNLLTPTSVISRYPPDDNAKISGSRDVLFTPDSVVISSVSFNSTQSPPSLVVLECALSALTKNSTTYSLTKENCWFFCATVVERLAEFGGKYGNGQSLMHPKQGLDARKAIQIDFHELLKRAS